MNKSRVVTGVFPGLAFFMAFLLMAGCAAMPGFRQTALEMDPAEKEALLRQRVQEIWHAQANDDRETMYEYYDPFFRARVKKGFFGVKTVPIYYFNPAIESLEVRGNVATVRVRMEYEVRGYPGQLGPIDVPRKQNVDHETWLFIDGTWYRQYINYLTDSSFAKY